MFLDANQIGLFHLILEGIGLINKHQPFREPCEESWSCHQFNGLLQKTVVPLTHRSHHRLIKHSYHPFWEIPLGSCSTDLWMGIL